MATSRWLLPSHSPIATAAAVHDAEFWLRGADVASLPHEGHVVFSEMEGAGEAWSPQALLRVARALGTRAVFVTDRHPADWFRGHAETVFGAVNASSLTP